MIRLSGACVAGISDGRCEITVCIQSHRFQEDRIY